MISIRYGAPDCGPLQGKSPESRNPGLKPWAENRVPFQGRDSRSFRDLRPVHARRPQNLRGRSDCWGWNGIQGHRGQGSSISCINLAVFLNRTTRNKILELLISAQAQHFSASVCSVSSAEVIM